jgi:hypothetical protein
VALLASIALIAGWSFLTFRATSGAKAIVYVANKKTAWYDLTGPRQEVAIPTRIGPVTVEIGEGAARVISSPCLNKICVKTGKVRHTHEEVVCVPAHMLVVIEGDASRGPAGGEVDVITF